MAILSGFKTLASSSAITCSESLSCTRFDRKLTFNFLRKSYKPIRIDSGSFRLDHPAIGKLFAAKENSAMGNLLGEEPACVNDDSQKTAIKVAGLASGSEAMKKHVDKRPLKSVPEYIDAGHASSSEVKATSQHLRMSVPKVQRVIDQIRGRSYEEALMVLELMPYRACLPVLKLVYSAAANACHNMGLNEADLFVSKVEVNGGRTIQRSRPRARGRSYPIRKPTCHITVVLKDRSKLF